MQVWAVDASEPLRAELHSGAGNCIKQLLSIFLMRVVEDFLSGSCLDNLPLVHHAHMVRDESNDGQIVQKSSR